MLRLNGVRMHISGALTTPVLVKCLLLLTYMMINLSFTKN